MHFAHWCHLRPSHQHIEKKVKGCDPIVPQVDQKHLELSCPLFARSYWKHDGKSKGDFILPNILPKCSCHFAHLGMGQNHSKITIEITIWFREWPSKNPSYDLGYHPGNRLDPHSRGVTGVSLFVSDLGNHGWRVDRKATPDSMVGLKAQDHGSEVAEEWVISMDATIIMVISWDI